MRRREFLAGLGGAAALPLAAPAPCGSSAEAFATLGAAFRQGLNESGFVEGRNVVFESRWANGQFERLPDLADALVGRRPAVIVTVTLPGALAAKAASNNIPIVFVVGEDPVKVGLVASFSRLGGNVTGMTSFMNVLGVKRLELVSEAVPKATALALLVNPNNPNAESDTRDLQVAANALDRRLHILTAKTDPDRSGVCCLR